jgi:hypothetical protein
MFDLGQPVLLHQLQNRYKFTTKTIYSNNNNNNNNN